MKRVLIILYFTAVNKMYTFSHVMYVYICLWSENGCFGSSINLMLAFVHNQYPPTHTHTHTHTHSLSLTHTHTHSHTLPPPPPPSHIQAKSVEEVLSDKQGLERERVWVVHRGGFSLGTVQPEAAVSSAFSTHFSIVRYQVRGPWQP